MEAVAASLSFGFVRFAPAPREREPRVNLFSYEVDEERLNRSGNDGDRRHDSTASASAARTTERDRFSHKSETERDGKREGGGREGGGGSRARKKNDSREGEREVDGGT